METPYEITRTEAFDAWLSDLKDNRGKALILRRLDSIRLGNLGDHKRFDGLVELRIFHGPGYRLYGSLRGAALILLLCGGDKGGQQQDIARAKRILAEWEDENGNQTF